METVNGRRYVTVYEYILGVASATIRLTKRKVDWTFS